MATVYKVLGQLAPSANTASTLYTVPSANSAVCSTLTICNGGAANAAVNVSVAVGGASANVAQNLVKSSNLLVNDTMFLTLGVTLAATDVIRVESDQANVSFQVFGSEISTS